jgi:succinyl-CoA synthetase beta subunit
MDLLEYQGKQLFRKHGVPVSDGRRAISAKAAEDRGARV